ncbi:MAG: hypothetical protein M1549_03275 [Candidatus Dependentiae bacterium]|nr:hypothetical protein [Candidatus Dependentiae bacterium]
MQIRYTALVVGLFAVAACGAGNWSPETVDKVFKDKKIRPTRDAQKLGKLRTNLETIQTSLMKTELAGWKNSDIAALAKNIVPMLKGISAKNQERIRQALNYLEYAVDHKKNRKDLKILQMGNITGNISGRHVEYCQSEQGTLHNLRKLSKFEMDTNGNFTADTEEKRKRCKICPIQEALFKLVFKASGGVVVDIEF